MMFITRVRLWANTCRAISEATRGSVFVKKCAPPIRALIVPKGCRREPTCEPHHLDIAPSFPLQASGSTELD